MRFWFDYFPFPVIPDIWTAPDEPEHFPLDVGLARAVRWYWKVRAWRISWDILLHDPDNEEVTHSAAGSVVSRAMRYDDVEAASVEDLIADGAGGGYDTRGIRHAASEIQFSEEGLTEGSQFHMWATVYDPEGISDFSAFARAITLEGAMRPQLILELRDIDARWNLTSSGNFGPEQIFTAVIDGVPWPLYFRADGYWVADAITVTVTPEAEWEY
jgi:hypothetical protein